MSAKTYGRHHGVQFSHNPHHEQEPWLGYMKARLGERYEEYEDGFEDGVLGLCDDEFGHLLITGPLEAEIARQNVAIEEESEGNNV